MTAGARIFVVDDEKQICALLERLLAREGHDVTAFDRPEDALAAAERERPDLLVTDLMMPGMSGLELIERVRERLPDIGALVITGYASIENVVDALRGGVNDFVTKPFSVAEIRSVTARLLEERADRIAAGAAAPAADERTAPPEVPGIRLPGDASGTLARRLAEMSLRERIHALLGDVESSLEVLPRLGELFRSALDVSHAALLVPSLRDRALDLHATTAGRAARPLHVDEDAPWVRRARERSCEVSRDELDQLDAVLDVGPAAAAPLARRRGGVRDGLLVVTRTSDTEPFDQDDLRRLGVAALATGDVVEAMRATERAEDAYVDTLAAIVTATEIRSPWFARHSERVRDLSLRLGRQVGLGEDDLLVIDAAARLLDLGRLQIPDDLLAKVAPPSSDEWQTLRQHVAVADTMLRPVGRLRHVKPVIRHHHENWDGSGYPDGLRGQEIPYLAALVRITDAYAALTSPRAWRAALSPDEALAAVRDLAGSHFHPDLTDAFVASVEGGPEDSP